MLNTNDILETIRMIHTDHLDIRTITMGVSLLDCASDDADVFASRIYDKITKSAERLVPVGEEIEKELGIPIVNKRISVTPIAIAGGALRGDGMQKAARALDRAAETTGVNFIGGFSALVQKGATPADLALIAAIPQALAETERVCSSVNVASTKAGINMDAVGAMGHVIKKAAALTADRDCIGCAKLVVFANAAGGQPVYGRRVPRHQRGRLRHQRRRLRPGRGAQRHRRGGRLRFNRAGGNHQAHRL